MAYRKIKINKNNYCKNCGINSKRLIRHHCDYNKPIEIIILCDKCHNNWHKNNKAVERKDYKKKYNLLQKNDIKIKGNKKYLLSFKGKKMEELRLQFKGDKEQLKKQLKVWCAEADKTMTGTIIELIEKHLKSKGRV